MRVAYGKPINLPLSHAIGTEEFVFVTGQVGSDANGVYLDDIAEQTRVTMDKIAALLAEAGSGMEKVVKTTVFLRHMSEFHGMNAVYARYFPSEPPARSTIGCALVDAGALVEIEAIALR